MSTDAPVMLTPEQFLRGTRPNTTKVITGQSIVENQKLSVRLPQVGLGNVIWVRLHGTVTITADTITAGTFQSYPNFMPLGLIQRVELSSNNGLLMRSLTGWNWYLWLRSRYGIDPLGLNAGTYQSSGNETIIGLDSTDRIVGGATVTEKTYEVDMVLPMPIAYNRSGDTGLLVLQQNSVFYDLDFQFSQIASGIGALGGTNQLFNGLTGTNIEVTYDMNLSVALDWFDIIPGVGNLTSMFMSARDQSSQPINVGRNDIYLPKDDYFTMMIVQAYNAGLPIPATDLTNLTLEHSGNVVVYQEDGPINTGRSFWDKRVTMPDGTFVFDMGIRRGTLDRRDTYDAFDNTLVTNALVRFDTPGSLTPSGFNGWSAVWETLRFFRQ